VLNSDLCFTTAVDLAHRIRTRSLSARELMQATLVRIADVDPKLNAIVTLVPERALAWAAEADERQARGAPLGPLHGLPIAHKDLVMTAGIRSTAGSKLLVEFVPQQDDLIVTRLRAAGAITVGKTNTPEFGAGSQTFNEVFGATRNPWDTSKTCCSRRWRGRTRARRSRSRHPGIDSRRPWRGASRVSALHGAGISGACRSTRA
jgi:amidase